jgi:hypothetical protein
LALHLILFIILYVLCFIHRCTITCHQYQLQ